MSRKQTQKLRKRGWSIHSMNTEATEDTGISEGMKEELFSSLPDDVAAIAMAAGEDEPGGATPLSSISQQQQQDELTAPSLNSSEKKNKKKKKNTVEVVSDNLVIIDDSSNSNNDDVIHLEDSPSPPPPGGSTTNRHHLGNNKAAAEEESKTQEDDTKQQQRSNEEIAAIAKQRLSKWAARLFDPDRPRGLIEVPQEIPQNDEFLSAFGKRERDRGVDVEEEKTIVQDNNIDGETVVDSDVQDTSKRMIVDDSNDDPTNCKVKLSNIQFNASAEMIHSLCETYGPIVKVDLVMDPDRPNLNKGFCYVIFDNVESAKDCAENLNKSIFGGRALVVSISSGKNKRRSFGGPQQPDAPGKSRYYVKDISSKCFRCGEVGHTVRDCPHEQVKSEACTTCGRLGHERFKCFFNKICFSCGVPSHVAGECLAGRNLPKRALCTTCFESTHHRWQCKTPPWHIVATDARCMVCDRKGHFICKDLRWKHGLEGVTCYNCGERGHHGSSCKRPNFDTCARDLTVTNAEIDRAFTWTESLPVVSNERGRGANRNFNSNNDGSRARSMPPQKKSKSDDFDREYSSNNVYQHHQFSHEPPPPPREFKRPTPPPAIRQHYRHFDSQPYDHDQSHRHRRRW